MTYEEVISTIENKRRFGKACGRQVTEEFMKALGYPEKDFSIIHIAGTNGKGSTAAFVSSILQAASFSSKEPYKVGTFISPHLIDFTERIMIDGVQIPRERAREIGERLLNTPMELEPTMFDYCLAMAMVYFKEEGVKYVVLETGLGGAKDSTSGLSIVPLVCAITSIGLEHTAILGNTIEEIAAEKAGILKEGTRLVIGSMDPSAREVIESEARAKAVEYTVVSELGKEVELGLFGDYQRKNGAVAFEIAKYLGINEDTILEGLRTANWRGRMDIISREPFVMLDGAHNPHGVRALRQSLVERFPGEKFTFIMAVMADKDYVEMANILKDIAGRVYTCTVDYSRALQSDGLAIALKENGFDAVACRDFDQAISLAKEGKEKVICFGSLYFIGDVLKEYVGRI